MGMEVLSESVVATIAFNFSKNKKYKCKTCGHFTMNPSSTEKGICKLTDNNTFVFGSCKRHTVLISSRNRWLHTTIQECPVCGKTTKIIKHIKDRPKPSDMKDRFIYEQVYDHCIKD